MRPLWGWNSTDLSPTLPGAVSGSLEAVRTWGPGCPGSTGNSDPLAPARIRGSTSLGTGPAGVPLPMLSGPSPREPRGEARSQGKFQPVPQASALPPGLERAQLTDPQATCWRWGWGLLGTRGSSTPRQLAHSPRSGLGSLGLPPAFHIHRTCLFGPDTRNHRPAGRPGPEPARSWRMSTRVALLNWVTCSLITQSYEFFLYSGHQKLLRQMIC